MKDNLSISFSESDPITPEMIEEQATKLNIGVSRYMKSLAEKDIVKKPKKDKKKELIQIILILLLGLIIGMILLLVV